MWEMAENVRNPISTVNEYCQAHQTCANFKVVHEEGEPHLKLFTISCTVFDKVTTGTGRSIKQAKLDSATAMITKLKKDGLLYTDDMQGKKKKSLETLSNKFSELKVNENPVGCLQEYCVAQKLPFPQYTNIVSTSGFATVCRINDVSCQGCGMQKKTAKANAARKMCEVLMKKLQIKSEVSYYRKDEVDAPGSGYEEATEQITVKDENKHADDETEELKNEFEKLLIQVDVNLKNVIGVDNGIKKENEEQ